MSRKDDGGKPQLSLLPWRALIPVVRVLEYGAAKYVRDGWRRVPDGVARYREALLRHTIEVAEDLHSCDPESGLPHLALLVCNGLFLLALGGFGDPGKPWEKPKP